MAERTPISIMLEQLKHSPQYAEWFETPPPWMHENGSLSEDTKKRTTPDPENTYDGNLHRIDVPGADFSLRIHINGEELPATLTFPSIDQTYAFHDLHETVSAIMDATNPNASNEAQINAVGMIEGKQYHFNLSNAWRMESYKQFLEENDVLSLTYSVSLPTFLNQQIGTATVFSYHFFNNSHRTQQREGISLSKGLAKHFPTSLAHHLLFRHSDYNRSVTKDPEIHADSFSTQVQAIANKRFPDPFDFTNRGA